MDQLMNAQSIDFWRWHRTMAGCFILSIMLFMTPGLASETIAIAPLEDALSFARVKEGDTLRTIAVLSHQGGAITGVPLDPLMANPADDPITLVNRHGTGYLRAFVGDATSRVTAKVTALVMPIDLANSHIAAGTNYKAHAEEASVDTGPFLFAKNVAPTGPFAPIPAGDGLLDYEVELCLVTLRAHDPASGTGGLGLVLCNDVTDREALIRNADVDDPGSGKGFTTGKSSPGFLPVGTLFVVPRNLDQFVEDMELKLWVNGALRQNTPVTLWIWPPAEILSRAAAIQDRRWDWRGVEVALPFENNMVPARTLVLAGTPDGTIFVAPGLSVMALGFLDWLFGGWDKSIIENVIDRYVDDARNEKLYLQPGDEILIKVDRMGLLMNKVVP
jgi:2,4-diketo-3-deoxy-L-fuconate hydrolase